MSFNWVQFLNKYRVEYVTDGPNVARGNLNIHCPWCGDADPSHHLGIHLRGKGWACWRNIDHRGKSPVRLIRVLLGCSLDEALRISGTTNTQTLDDKQFFSAVKVLMGRGTPKPVALINLQYPPGLLSLGETTAPTFRRYLRQRSYTETTAPLAARRYRLRGALRGVFRYRLVFPVHMYGRLVNMTGRDITGRSPIRYLSLPTEESRWLPRAPMSIKATLWNYDDLVKRPGDTLVVCEGPFDAMRVDYFGQRHGIRATCVFSKTIQDAQVTLLETLMPLYKRRLLCFDDDSELDRMHTLSKIEHLTFAPVNLPPGVHDPALLSPQEVVELFVE